MTHDDEERLVEATPNRRQGASARKWTGVIQGVVALFMLGFWIPLVLLRFNEAELPRQYKEGVDWQRYRFHRFLMANVMDNVGSGMWAPLVFLVTAIVGYCSRRSRSVVALYCALCLFSVCVSIAAGGVIAGAISTAVYLKGHVIETCAIANIYSFDESWCDGPYILSYPYYHHGPELNEWDCEQYYRCKDEIYRKAKIHLPLYAVTVACAVIEFVCGILGACFSCGGLCKWADCCKAETRLQPQQMVFCGIDERGQLTNLPGHMPSNAPFLPPMSMPGVSSGVSYQPVNTA